MASLTTSSRCMGASRPFRRTLTSAVVVPKRSATAIYAEDEGRNPTDWDNAWAKIRQQMASQVDTSGRNRSPPPRRAKPVSPQQDRLRKQAIEKPFTVDELQERVLLDIVTTEEFFRFGAIGATALLLIFALYIGPPPDDGRCTLPWC